MGLLDSHGRDSTSRSVSVFTLADYKQNSSKKSEAEQKARTVDMMTQARVGGATPCEQDWAQFNLEICQSVSKLCGMNNSEIGVNTKLQNRGTTREPLGLAPVGFFSSR